MTDATDPLALTPDEEVMLATAAKEVTDAAKRTFRLGDRLRGVKLATAKLIVFTDLEAVAEWQAQERVTEMLAARTQVYENGSDEQVAAVAEMTESEEKAEPLKRAAYDKALAIHMRAIPRAAYDAAQREVRKAYENDAGVVPDDKSEAAFDLQQELLLGQVVLRIVDATGAEAEFDRRHLGQMLRDTLGMPQYERVVEAFNRLMFNDSLARAAVDDPGF